MARTTIDDLKARRLGQMSEAELAEFDATYAATKLALEVGEQVRDAREAAGLTQRELASRSESSTRIVAPTRQRPASASPIHS